LATRLCRNRNSDWAMCPLTFLVACSSHFTQTLSSGKRPASPVNRRWRPCTEHKSTWYMLLEVVIVTQLPKGVHLEFPRHVSTRKRASEPSSPCNNGPSDFHAAQVKEPSTPHMTYVSARNSEGKYVIDGNNSSYSVTVCPHRPLHELSVFFVSAFH
jgi:hypothetical protein